MRCILLTFQYFFVVLGKDLGRTYCKNNQVLPASSSDISGLTKGTFITTIKLNSSDPGLSDYFYSLMTINALFV